MRSKLQKMTSMEHGSLFENTKGPKNWQEALASIISMHDGTKLFQKLNHVTGHI